MNHRTTRNIRVAGALALAIAAGLARPAAALPGNGIRLGGSEGRLHPFVELETRYDSNAYYQEAADQGAVVVHTRPGFRLDVPSDLARVELNASLDWAQHVNPPKDSGSGLSRMYGQAGLGIGVNRSGTLGLELEDDFRRTSGSDAMSLGSAVITNRNDLRVAMPWTPGGGALVLTLGGGWHLESYEAYYEQGSVCAISSIACDATALSKLGFSELRGDAELRWKFLPRTAAVFDAGFFSHLANSSLYGVDASGLRTRVGLSGLLTRHLAGTIRAGYADTFGSAPEPVRTWLGTAEVEWLATDTASLRLGFDHDLGIDPGALYSLYTKNRVYADGRILFGSRYTARLALNFDRREYALARDSTSSVVRVEPSFEAELARWMVVSLSYAYTSRASELLTVTSAVPGFEYTKNEVWTRATFTY